MRSSLRPTPEFSATVARLDHFSSQRGLRRLEVPTGRQYLPVTVEPGCRNPNSGVGVFATSRGIEVNLQPLRDNGRSWEADNILAFISEITDGRANGREFPYAPCGLWLQAWDRAIIEVFERYFAVRRQIVAEL